MCAPCPPLPARAAFAHRIGEQGPFAAFYDWLVATKGIKVVQVPILWPLNSTDAIVDAFRATLRSAKADGHVAYVRLEPHSPSLARALRADRGGWVRRRW